MKGIRGLVSPGTIKKEIITLRTTWNWGVQFGLVTGKYPNKDLRYAKVDEKPPFQTFAEIERKLHGLSKKQIAELWDEQRAVRASIRFGDRDLIIQRARHEERLSRAA